VLARVIVSRFTSFSQDEHTKVRLAPVQFGHKLRRSEALAIEPADNQAELVGELWLLKEAKSVGGISCTMQFAELPA